VSIRAAEVRARHQWDEYQSARCAWDASDAARLDAAENVERRLPELEDEDAGKSADQEQADRAQDVQSQPLEHWLGPQVPLVLVALCTRAVVRFAGRSCAARGHRAQQALPGGALPPEAQRKPQWTAASMRPEQPALLAALEAQLPWARLQQLVFPGR
jgi:hypothetical protein